MTITERDCETIRRCVRKPMNTVSREIVILPLFAVCDDRRACRFKSLNGVSNRIFIERSEARILTVAFCDSVDEINGFGRYTDRCRLSQYFIVVGWPMVTPGTIALQPHSTTAIY
jgi:hypothetical protein